MEMMNLHHGDADDTVGDEQDGLAGGHVVVARDGEAGDGEGLADGRRAPEHELTGGVDLPAVLAGRQEEDQSHVGEEGEDRAGHVSHHHHLREVAEDELEDGQDRGSDGEEEPEDNPGRPGHLPGLAGQAVVDVEGEGDQQDGHWQVDQHGGLETFCELRAAGVPSE